MGRLNSTYGLASVATGPHFLYYKGTDMISWECDEDFFKFLKEQEESFSEAVERLAFEPKEIWIKRLKKSLKPKTKPKLYIVKSE